HHRAQHVVHVQAGARMVLNPATPCFLALTPDDAFAATVLAYKRLTEQRVGPQLYLNDPPHLTLYLACFADLPALRMATRHVAPTLRAPTATVYGWHLFRDDPLNGNHTLVCDISADGLGDLSLFQNSICDAVSPLRDPDSTLARYAPF